MHPQKYAEGHRSYGCGAVWQSFTLSVFFCAILWMCFVISFARRTNGHAEVIEHDGEQASTSHAVERCQEPPSTTYRALNRLTLGGSRHLRRNDSRPRCAQVFAAQRRLAMPSSCSSLLNSSRRARTRITANERSLQDRNRDCTVTQGYAAPVPGYARPGLVEPTFQVGRQRMRANLLRVVVTLWWTKRAQRERARASSAREVISRSDVGATACR